jgi:acetyl-CoA synthetase
MATRENTIDTLLTEDRSFAPPEDFRKRAHVTDDAPFRRAEADPEAYWAEWASQLHWFQPWSEVLRWNAPQAEWFVGGKLNAAYNCLDRHLDGPRRTKTALIWEGEPGDERRYTYEELHHRGLPRSQRAEAARGRPR